MIVFYWTAGVKTGLAGKNFGSTTGILILLILINPEIL
jgi:hypothetical protein